MKSELSFLLELLLKHKLDDSTRELIAERIASVEEQLEMKFTRGPVVMPTQTGRPIYPENGPPIRPAAPIHTNPQTSPHPSTLTPEEMAALAEQRNASPITPAVIAQTPQAQQALRDRQAAISKANGGKMQPEEGRTGPRKF